MLHPFAPHRHTQKFFNKMLELVSNVVENLLKPQRPVNARFASNDRFLFAYARMERIDTFIRIGWPLLEEFHNGNVTDEEKTVFA